MVPFRSYIQISLSVFAYFVKSGGRSIVLTRQFGTGQLHTSPGVISRRARRSYGEKPAWYLAEVPSGLLPAIKLDGQVSAKHSVVFFSRPSWNLSLFPSA